VQEAVDDDEMLAAEIGSQPLKIPDIIEYLKDASPVQELELAESDWAMLLQVMDGDGDGMMRHAEMKAHLLKHQAVVARPRNVRERQQGEMVQDGGPIALLMQTLQGYAKTRKLRLIDLFKKWDEDGSGDLSFEEIKTHLSQVPGVTQMGLSKAEWRNIQKQIDGNNDKKISFKELNGTLSQHASTAGELARARLRAAEGKLLLSEVFGAMKRNLVAKKSDFRADYREHQRRQKLRKNALSAFDGAFNFS